MRRMHNTRACTGNHALSKAKGLTGHGGPGHQGQPPCRPWQDVMRRRVCLKPVLSEAEGIRARERRVTALSTATAEAPDNVWCIYNWRQNARIEWCLDHRGCTDG